MRHIEEQILELFVLHPDSLEKKTQDAVHNHLGACLVCRETVKFLRSTHSDLRSLQYEDHPKVTALLDSLFPATNVIHLHPYRYIPDPTAFDEKYTTLLAAMTEDVAQQRFVAVATLVSEKDNALVRIMHDRQEDRLKLYVNADDPHRREFVIVSMSEIAAEFVTDKDGSVSFELSKDKVPADWKSVGAVLRTAIDERQLDVTRLAAQTDPLLIDLSQRLGVTLRVSYRNGTLSIMSEPGPNSKYPISRVVVSAEGRNNLLLVLREGKAECKWDKPDGQLTFRFYQ